MGTRFELDYDSNFKILRSIQVEWYSLTTSFCPYTGAYFKVEQEASIQEHKRRLIKEGKLNPDNDANSAPSQSFNDSEAAYDTLPEVLQAQARVDAPNAAKRKEYELRIKGAPEPLTDEERWRYRAASGGAFSAAVGHVPRLSLSGRNRYGIPSSNSTGDLALRTPLTHSLSPEAAEVARRSYVAGVRALVYGSLLGVGLIALGGTATAQYIGIGSGQDFREKVQNLMLPLKESLRERVLPWKIKAETWIGTQAASNNSNGDASPDSLQARLRNRYNPSSNSST